MKATSYDYLGGLTWAKDTDELTKAKHRTYSERRGYARVRTRVGAGGETKSLAETRYFRGIDGADVPDSEDTSVTDREAFAGTVREEIGYGRDGGGIIDVQTEGTRELKKDGT